MRRATSVAVEERTQYTRTHTNTVQSDRTTWNVGFADVGGTGSGCGLCFVVRMPEKSKVCVEFIPLQDACSVDSLAGIFTDFTAFEHWRGEHLHAGHEAGLVCL